MATPDRQVQGAEPLGRQLLVELHGCSATTLDDVASIEALLLRAADDAGATVVSRSFHRFAPHGISGMLLIAESHLVVHTWPEHQYCAFDIFTCGTTLDAEAAIDTVRLGLQAGQYTVVEMRRGMLAPDA